MFTNVINKSIYGDLFPLNKKVSQNIKKKNFHRSQNSQDHFVSLLVHCYVNAYTHFSIYHKNVKYIIII